MCLIHTTHLYHYLLLHHHLRFYTIMKMRNIVPPPPLLPQELTHPNELLPDCVQRTNSDDHTQHPSLKTTTDKISLHDTEDDSNKASYKVKSDKVKKKSKNLRIHLRFGKQNGTSKHQTHDCISIRYVQKEVGLLTKRQTQPAIMSRFLGMMTSIS